MPGVHLHGLLADGLYGYTWLKQTITLPLIFMSLPCFVIAAFNATSVFINTVSFMLFALMTLPGNLFRVLVSLWERLFLLLQFACLAHKPLWIKLTVLTLHRGVVLEDKCQCSASSGSHGRQREEDWVWHIIKHYVQLPLDGMLDSNHTSWLNRCVVAGCESQFYSGDSASYFCTARPCVHVS